MDLKELLEAKRSQRASIYKRMVDIDATIKKWKDSGKPNGMLVNWGIRSKKHRDELTSLDQEIDRLENRF
jgi:hypothetical protein